MERYPHEILIEKLKHIKIPVRNLLIVVGFIMLVFSTAATTIILLDLPRHPNELLGGFIAGMGITTFIGTGLHIMIGELG